MSKKVSTYTRVTENFTHPASCETLEKQQLKKENEKDVKEEQEMLLDDVIDYENVAHVVNVYYIIGKNRHAYTSQSFYEKEHFTS